MLKDVVFCIYCAWTGFVDRTEDVCPMCDHKALQDLQQDVEVGA